MADRKVAIYPADKNAFSLVRYFETYTPQVSIKVLLAPSGLGTVGKDFAVTDNREAIGLIVENSAHTERLNRCTDLVIMPGTLQEPKHVDSLRLMQTALQNGIKVHCAMTLDEAQRNELQCENFYELKAFELNEAELAMDKVFHQPKVPVIFVTGLMGIINTAEIVFGLGAEFIKSKYKVAVVAGDETSRLMGMYPVPSFLYNHSLSEVEKILQFNKYIQHIEETLRPNVILVQVPGGFGRLSPKIHNDFGVYYYLISQAVLPDAAVLCVPVNRCDNQVLNDVSNACDKKFGFTFDVVFVSNVFADPIQDESSENAGYLHHFPEQAIAAVAKCKENDIPAFNMINENEMAKAYECILKRLT